MVLLLTLLNFAPELVLQFRPKSSDTEMPICILKYLSPNGILNHSTASGYLVLKKYLNTEVSFTAC